MYLLLLGLHNLARWAVVILALIALWRAYRGWLGKQPWTAADRKIGSFFTISMDVQLLLGLILYIFLSPITRAAFTDFGAAMGSAELRFFAVEHLTLMLIAVVTAHVGAVRARSAATDEARHRQAAIWVTATAVLVLLAIPWPFPLLGAVRPLLRLPF
jgi:uncharacterized membrane protein YozB (DUF420 family)